MTYHSLIRKLTKDLKEVHIDKHFVLLFSVDENTKMVTLEEFDHHTKLFKE